MNRSLNPKLKSMIDHLLSDESFIRWVIDPTDQSNEYWEKRMSEDEELNRCATILRKTLKNIRVDESDLTVDMQEQEEVLNRILQEIDRPKLLPGRAKSRRAVVWGASVAASFLLLLGGYWFFTQEDRMKEIDYSHYATGTDDFMRRESISLLLSNNEQIDIDQDSVMITYDATGAVNIDSKEIEKRPQATGKKEKPMEMNRLIVPYGKTSSLLLSDGTKIWINSGSTVVYPTVFEKNRREIYLVGEAMLDVVSNKESPFIVKTGNVELNVLGTTFNISAYADDDEQSVVLVSGLVEVRGDEIQEKHTLVPNQRFAFLKESKAVSVEEVNVEDYTAWVHGNLICNRENMYYVLQKVARHFNKSLVYDEELFKKETFSGKLDMRVPIEKVLDYITAAVPVKYTITNADIHVEFSNE